MKRYQGILGGLAVIIALAAGGVLRVSGAIPMVNSEMIYSAPDTREIPEPTDPSAAVVRFYMLIDRGRYKEAWAMSIEPNWSGNQRIGFRDEVISSQVQPAGWTDESSFVERCMDDLGPAGVFLALSHLRAVSIRGTEPPGLLIALPAEYRDNPTDRVRISGDFLASCAVYRWKKDVSVVETPHGYKVYLDGIKKKNELFHMTWLNFDQKQLIRELRSQ